MTPKWKSVCYEANDTRPWAEAKVSDEIKFITLDIKLDVSDEVWQSIGNVVMRLNPGFRP